MKRRRAATLLASATGGLMAAPPASAWMPGPPPGPRSAPTRPVVAIGRRAGLLSASGALDAALLADGLGAAVARAVGEKSPVAALRRLFAATDVVGIKVNTLGGRGVSTRPEVALQLATWLQAAGVPADRIHVWDRSTRELREAGYAISAGSRGVRVFGTDEAGWGPLVDWGESASRFARILTEDLTAVISCAVLKDHSLAGVSLSMKNWFGVVHNPNKLHDDGCAPSVAALSMHPLVLSKLRLNVIDGSLAQCHGGPGRAPRWAFPYGGFLASTDPVALDRVGAEIIEARRRELGLPALAAEGRPPRWLEIAAAHGLGISEPGRIERVEV